MLFLSGSEKSVGLQVNQENIKYLVVCRGMRDEIDIQNTNKWNVFYQIADFKYLEYEQTKQHIKLN